VHGAEVVKGADAVDQGGVEVLAPARSLSDDEGGENAGDGVMGGAEAAPRGVVEDRPRPEAEVTAGEDAGLGRHHALIAFQAGVGAGWPEPADLAVDEARVGLAQVVLAEVPLFELAGGDSSDQDIGMDRGLSDHGPAVFGAEIGHEALLATVPDEKA